MKQNLNRIVIFRALQLGDMLCVVPALRALRLAYPRSHITLIGLPWAADFARRFDHYLDDFVAFPGYPGLPEIEPDIAALPGFFAAMQKRRFDLAVQLHGSGSYVNSIVALFNAQRVAGFYSPGEWCPDPSSFMPWPDTLAEPLRYLALLRFLDIAASDAELEFPHNPEDERCLRERGLIPDRKYVVIHPGAQLPSRRWPLQNFIALANFIGKSGYDVVITGTKREAQLTAALAAASQVPVRDLGGQTSLGELAGLLRRARLLIANDTGLSHLAAALHVPSVIACFASDSRRWAPLNHGLHRIVDGAPLSCRPCSHHSCPIGHPCAASVTLEAMREEVARHLMFECAPG